MLLLQGLHHPAALGWGLLAGWGAGAAFWEFSVFFRADYFSWADVARGLVWPLYWARWRYRRRSGAGQR